jgi:hypothetical protein
MRRPFHRAGKVGAFCWVNDALPHWAQPGSAVAWRSTVGAAKGVPGGCNLTGRPESPPCLLRCRSPSDSADGALCDPGGDQGSARDRPRYPLLTQLRAYRLLDGVERPSGSEDCCTDGRHRDPSPERVVDPYVLTGIGAVKTRPFDATPPEQKRRFTGPGPAHSLLHARGREHLLAEAFKSMVRAGRWPLAPVGNPARRPATGTHTMRQIRMMPMASDRAAHPQ